jgi:PST family polysaccharide transporter
MLSRKVAVGSLLLGLVSLAARFLGLVLIVILARLLTPEDFGLVALAASVLIVTQSVTELQVFAALVQRRDLGPRDIDAAFTLGLMRGSLVALALLLLAWPVARLYADPRLAPMIAALALAPFAAGLASPMMVHFLRRVDYGPSVRNQLVSRAAAFAAALAVALITQSYWAQVAGLVAAPVALTLASYVSAPYRPRLTLTGIRSILAFAGWITASRIVNALNQQGDRFFLGGILGKEGLGFYAVGSDMSSSISYSMSNPLLQTLFAGFSRISDQAERMRRAFLRGQQVMAAFLLPLGVGLAVLARPIVTLLLGPKWEPVIPVVTWLAPAIALQMMTVSIHSAAMAMGRPRLLLTREIIALALRLPATVLAAWWFGLAAAAMARAAASVAMVAINLVLAAQLLQIGVWQQIAACGRSLASAAVMAGGLTAAMAQTGAVGWAGLAGLVGLGAALYGGVHLLLWWAAGRPEGAETFALDLLRAALARLRRPRG